jgi:ribonuclease HI
MAHHVALGAFRTTPISALHYDTNTESTITRLDRKVTFSAIRLLTLPQEHPIAPLARRALTRDTKSHRTALQSIFHSPSSLTLPDDLESVLTSPHSPWWQPAITGHIATSKDEAEDLHAKLPLIRDHFHIYSDGSKTEEGIGASAYVSNPATSELSYHLGTEGHTVFEAELIGIILALHLAHNLPRTARSITIHLDNQAAIKACTSHACRQSAQYLILLIHEIREKLKFTHRSASVALNWIPGHRGIPGNEHADRLAKEAATDQNRRDISLHLHASLAHTRQIARTHFASPSENPRSGHHHRRCRGDVNSRSTLRALSKLPRSHCSIIVQLRSGHIALRKYLARFARAEDPLCPTCHLPESVDHFLLICKRFNKQRKELFKSIHAIDKKINHRRLSVLLSHPDVLPLTAKYAISTGRFPLHAKPKS